jgi:two-component system aerobic respiration control sensor histidine kinase ArcB
MFDLTAQHFIRNKSFNADEAKVAFLRSIDYLKEEAAAMCLWPKLDCHYEIYYSKRSGPMSLTYDTLLKTQYPHLLQPLSLRFKKQKNSKNIISINDTFALHHLIQIMPGHVFWKNKDGVYLGCNLKQAQYYGFDSPDCVVNKTDSDILGAEVGATLRKNDLEIMSHTGVSTIEESNKGDIFLSSKTAIRDPNGNAVGIIGCAINITEQKRLEIDLRQQTEVLTEALKIREYFLNNLSHEIKTPLHVITALANELDEDNGDLSAEERQEYRHLLNITTQKLLCFVQNILMTAKAKQGKLTSDFTRIDLIALIKKIIKEMQVISSAPIDMLCQEDQKVEVKCAAHQIEQVIRNLIENAIKYGKNTPIEVKIESDHDNVRTTVSDRGIGVPENERLKIFEAFEESSRTKTFAGGTGLGLSICKDILNVHNGKIWVEQNTPAGSRFIFTIPTKIKHEI